MKSTATRLLCCLLISVPVLVAESSDCNNPSVLVPDGRTVESTFAGSTTYWYGFQAIAGHSYSVEFLAPAENIAGSSKIQLAGFIIFAPSDVLGGCHGTSSVVTVATQNNSPMLATSNYGGGRRQSFIAQATGFHPLTITNIAAQGGPIAYRVVETTLFSPRWSTYSGYLSQWGFMNLSDVSVHGVFTVYSASNQMLTSVTVTIPPGQLAMRSSVNGDLSLPPNSSGYAIFGHYGPPQSLLVDAYALNGGATTVIPIKFETHGAQ